jgi:glycosyltransferase involved in cell wall biosynthesis
LSEHEAFGIAPLESAAAGSRIILSDIPAHREIVRRFLGAEAILIPPTAGATSIARAIARQLSAGLADEVFLPDWTSVAAATADVYRRVLERAVAARVVEE